MIIEIKCIRFPILRLGQRCANRFNLQAPVAQKVAKEVVFRRFQGEGVGFF